MSSPSQALIVGQDSIAQAVASELRDRHVDFQHIDNPLGIDSGEVPSHIFNLWYPEPGTCSQEEIWEYPRLLLEQGMQLGPEMAAKHESPAIVNFAFLPAIYVGTSLEDAASSLRGAITGVTRTLARKFGKQGLRVTGVQAGLVETAETQKWVTDAVKSAQVPTKRWGNPTEVAKFLVFLAQDSMYTTGQTMIIDGGLTAGISGT